MTQNRTVRHPDVSNLFKRGNYSLLRLLVIVNAAGPSGVTTRKLLDEIHSHDTSLKEYLTEHKRKV